MNNEVLVESQTARNEQIQRISNEDCIVKLNYVKKIDFNNFNENQVITTQDVSEFYKVVPETIRTLIKTNREELETDGLKTLSGQELQDARLILKLPSKSSQVTIWTPRAVLRAGMLLRDSEIAKAVRTALLDKIEEKPQSAIDVLEQVFNSFKEHQAKLNQHENKLVEHAFEINETKNELDILKDRIEEYRNKPDAENAKFSIDQYCRINNLEPSRGQSISGGRKLTSLARLLAIDFNDNGTRKNEYPYWLLKALFDTVLDFDVDFAFLIQKYLEYQIKD